VLSGWQIWQKSDSTEGRVCFFAVEWGDGRKGWVKGVKGRAWENEVDIMLECEGLMQGRGEGKRRWGVGKDKWCGVGAGGWVSGTGLVRVVGCELEIIMLCPVEPSSVLRGRPGRVGYSGGRWGVIRGRVVYIMSGASRVWGKKGVVENG